MRIFFIEGLLGSGKTTFARKISQHLDSLNIKNNYFSEGDLHPVDLAWIAILKKEDLNNLLIRYPMLESQIESNIKQIKDFYYLAYTKVKIDETCKDFYQYLSKYEIYQEEDLDKFFQAHKDLWLNFLEEKREEDIVYIFECIFLQNHINELILKFNLEDDKIISYFKEFEKLFINNKIKIFYIKQKNVKDVLERITEERRTNNKLLFKDWIDNVIEYVENSKYGTLLGYEGYQGIEKYFHYRQSPEIKVLNNLIANKEIISLDGNYDDVFLKMIDKLNL